MYISKDSGIHILLLLLWKGEGFSNFLIFSRFMSKCGKYRFSGLTWPIFLLWRLNFLLATTPHLALDIFLARVIWWNVLYNTGGNPVGQNIDSNFCVLVWMQWPYFQSEIKYTITVTTVLVWIQWPYFQSEIQYTITVTTVYLGIASKHGDHAHATNEVINGSTDMLLLVELSHVFSERFRMCTTMYVDYCKHSSNWLILFEEVKTYF
jgi:hypothetical protein